MRGPPDDVRMQANRQHLRGILPLGPQALEGVDAVVGEIPAADEGRRIEKAHAVGVEGVWQHEVGLAIHGDVVGRVVVVGVTVV